MGRFHRPTAERDPGSRHRVSCQASVAWADQADPMAADPGEESCCDTVQLEMQ